MPRVWQAHGTAAHGRVQLAGKQELTTCRDRLEEPCRDKGSSRLQVGRGEHCPGGLKDRDSSGGMRRWSSPTCGHRIDAWRRLGLWERRVAGA